jgi:3-phosphoshikimate 1-carboxyvinyltransferase
MNGLCVRPSGLHGPFFLPSSKSHTIRACFLAACAAGTSEILSPLFSPDTFAALRAIELFGASHTIYKDRIVIGGAPPVNRLQDKYLDVKNSGLVYRFATAFCAQSSDPILITGDQSFQHLRPIWQLTHALTQLGASCTFLQRPGFAPFLLQGPICPGSCQLDGQDSQPISSLLLSLPFLQGTSEIHVKNPGEMPWIKMTQSWLQACSIQYSTRSDTHYVIPGNQKLTPFERIIPRDMSALAFPLVAAILTDSEISIDGFDPSQGDACIVAILQQMGAKIDVIGQTLHTFGPQQLHGITIDVERCVDALPILAVAACAASSPTQLVGGSVCRYKESNRISVMVSQLQRLGGNILEHSDGLTIFPSSLYGATVSSYNDHRVAMALVVAGLICSGETCVLNTACIKKSYPQFYSSFLQAGVSISPWQ